MSTANNETSFLFSDKDCYAIYQIKPDETLRNHRFSSLSELSSLDLQLDRSNYGFIYSGELPQKGSLDDTLSFLFHKFNCSHPPDFKGHSLSLSDVIAIKAGGVITSYYVDSFSFTEISGFLR